ncbi:amidohydrolase family protein [Nonomuraea sp. NN258]|uniref:amidohydrolase family protein n=1 Tax=Nonomuraea antri TaxID=2730852 RepID=UPI0015682DFE|nr:amidohydrolase family protein [Nonomuraea antri]NRQ35325.1 amidohydrolase family protein [Nonomuraea antri]
MPPAKRTGPILTRRAPAPVELHSAPLVLPISTDPIRDAGVAVGGGRVLRVGPRAELLSRLPIQREVRWPGMIVAGLVDARSAGAGAEPGVIAHATLTADLTVDSAADPAGPAGRPGVSYLEVGCGSEQAWEDSERDAVITAIREVDRPCAVGLAAHARDPAVLEDLAVLARTFGLRLLVDLDRHSPAALDEAGILGPHCHVACARPLDPGERKLLRLRGTVAALCAEPTIDTFALLDEGNPIALGTAGSRTSGGGVLGQARAIRVLARERGLRTRGLDRRLVEAATLGGARALGMDRGAGRIGTLEPGGRADFAVYDARGRYPYAALLAGPPCLATVVGGVIRPPVT